MFQTKKNFVKEEEFIQLNAEIDLETKDLLEQADSVLKLRNQKDPFLNSHENISNGQQKEVKETLMKIFHQTTKGEIYKTRSKEELENGFGKTYGTDQNKTDTHGEDNEDGVKKINQIRSFQMKKSSEEDEVESSEDSRDIGIFEELKEDKSANKFSSLNRQKSNRSLKTSSSAKASIVSTTNIGQGVAIPGKLTRHKSDIRLKERTDNVLPESLKGMGQESIIRFLKAKVKLLTEQLELMQKDEKKHIEKIKELQGERDRVAEDRDKWIQQANIAKNVLVKHEQHASNIVIQLQNTQAENGHLKKEIEKLKKELKHINQNSGSNEVRLNRSIEEIEKLKTALRQSKQDEKDSREAQRKKIEELSGAVKRLDKQRVELLHAFKKQLISIDNLKKQRGLLEAGKMLKAIEDDFMEFLDWNPNKV